METNNTNDTDELMDEDYVQCLMSLDTNARPFLPSQNEPNLTTTLQNVTNEPEKILQEPVLGMDFESDEAAKGFYNEYARRLGFPFRVGRSRRSKGAEDVVIMKRFVCSKEGIYQKKMNNVEEGSKKRERISMREGCKAMMEVIRESSTRWVISKLETNHTHRLGLYSRSGYLRSRSNFLESSETKLNFPNLTSPDSKTNRNTFNEGQYLMDFFLKKQCENSNFFHAIQTDGNSSLMNCFWADARSRESYKHFGDVVVFDTTYKKNKYMSPFVVFSGINHHLKPVIFGCALLAEETEFSLIWLFETFLASMGNKAPISFITDQNQAVISAVSKVFPNTKHRFCKWLILSRTKQKLANLYNTHPTLRSELESCVIESKTIDSFEENWLFIIDRYELRKNTWLQLLYNIREKWVPLYLKDSFFGEMSPTQKMETINDFYKKHFNSKTSVKVFLTQFDLEMMSWHEEEANSDLDSLQSLPALKTASPIEKQAARVYTKAVFSIFQEEFVQSLGYVVNKITDGNVSKFAVNLDEDCINTFFVSYNVSQKTVVCSCGNFSFCGILCRHIFAVLLIIGPRILPNEYFLKRWSKNAKTDLQQDIIGNFIHESVNLRYSDLCSDIVRIAESGARSSGSYRNAKDVLHKAYEEILNIEKEMSDKVVHRDMNEININEEITIDDAMDDQLQDSERKVTNLLGQLLSSAWSPV